MKTGIRNTSYTIKNEKTDLALKDFDYAHIKADGYSYVDYQGFVDTNSKIYSMNDEDFNAFAMSQGELFRANGLDVYQVHSPWPTDDKTEESRAEKLVFMKRAIVGASHMGAKYFVVHPVMPYGWDSEDDADYALELNKELFTELCDFAKGYNIGICIENMPMIHHRISPMPEIVKFVKEMNNDNLFICLDTGHCNVFGDDCGEMVRLCGDKLKVLHIHDNMGDRDSHMVPFMGTIDWESFRQALKDINYTGVVSLETSVKGHLPKHIWDMESKVLSEIANYLGEYLD